MQGNFLMYSYPPVLLGRGKEGGFAYAQFSSLSPWHLVHFTEHQAAKQREPPLTLQVA